MNREQLRELLEQYGVRPRRRWGQNFLIEPSLIARIAEDAGVRAGDRVLEIGPGAGALTEALLAVGAELLAVEIDPRLAQLLEQRCRGERFRLIQADVLETDERFHPAVEAFLAEPPPVRVVANLPYSISGPFLARLTRRRLAGACLLLQEEVARKGVAGPGDDDYGGLAIRLQLAFRCRLGRRLPAEVFWPRPQVASAFLHLEPSADAPRGPVADALVAILRLAFGQRRKQLRGRLAEAMPRAWEALLAAGAGSRCRAEEIPPELWLRSAIAESE